VVALLRRRHATKGESNGIYGIRHAAILTPSPLPPLLGLLEPNNNCKADSARDGAAEGAEGGERRRGGGRSVTRHREGAGAGEPQLPTPTRPLCAPTPPRPIFGPCTPMRPLCGGDMKRTLGHPLTTPCAHPNTSACGAAHGGPASWNLAGYFLRGMTAAQDVVSTRDHGRRKQLLVYIAAGVPCRLGCKVGLSTQVV
jgi:hypothetical protein